MALQQLFDRNKQYEDAAVLDLDAVLHKATQETCEYLEAVQQFDFSHAQDEIADALTNILAVQYRLSPEFNGLTPTPPTKDVLPLDIVVHLGKWNDAVQKYRGVYSRSSMSLEMVTEKTQTLIGSLLSFEEKFSGKEVELEELCSKTIEKFGERADRYGKRIELTDYIRNIPDYPKPGIQFKDITPLLKDPRAFQYTVQRLSELAKNADVIVGLDARGFIFGGAVAERLGKPFIPIRKKGKLPYATIEDSYSLEYGEATQEMHIDAIQPGQKVAIIDDLLATAGTARSACNLITQLGGIIDGAYFVISLDDLGGESKLPCKAISLIHY